MTALTLRSWFHELVGRNPDYTDVYKETDTTDATAEQLYGVQVGKFKITEEQLDDEYPSLFSMQCEHIIKCCEKSSIVEATYLNVATGIVSLVYCIDDTPPFNVHLLPTDDDDYQCHAQLSVGDEESCALNVL